jgi:hypothetical protein
MNYSASSKEHLPKKIVVKARLSSRYDEHYADGRLQSGSRPARWENRIEGIDCVITDSGDRIDLLSDGQQSPPSEGWVLMLTSRNEVGYGWTLYGLPSA